MISPNIMARYAIRLHNIVDDMGVEDTFDDGAYCVAAYAMDPTLILENIDTNYNAYTYSGINQNNIDTARDLMRLRSEVEKYLRLNGIVTGTN